MGKWEVTVLADTTVVVEAEDSSAAITAAVATIDGQWNVRGATIPPVAIDASAAMATEDVATVLSVPEVAERLGLDRNSVHRMIREGRLPAVQRVVIDPQGGPRLRRGVTVADLHRFQQGEVAEPSE